MKHKENSPQRSNSRKSPFVLIIHLKRFDNFVRKRANDIEFPQSNLSLLNHVTPITNSTSYNLCEVTNQYRTQNRDTWYKCEDQNEDVIDRDI